MKEDKFIPVNKLEQLLVDASSDPSARPEFFEELLRSDIYILPAEDKSDMKEGIVEAGTSILLYTLNYKGEQYIPFYTSESRLNEGELFIKMSVLDFFNMTKGGMLALNPGFYFGKVFYPDEIEKLLDGSYLKSESVYVYKEPTEIFIGQPNAYPHETVEALSKLYSKMSGVLSAYIAMYHDPGRMEQPGLLILLDVDSEEALHRAISDSGIVIKDLVKEKFVDFAKFESNGLGKYFISNQIAPFFQKNRILIKANTLIQ